MGSEWVGGRESNKGEIPRHREMRKRNREKDEKEEREKD